VAGLDYRRLNDLIQAPADGAIARWLQARLAAPGLVAVGLQSTPAQGVDLEANGALSVWRRFELQSAHWLPNVPPGHKCGRLHGHGFGVVLHARTAAQGSDEAEIGDALVSAWTPVHAELDHRCLNDVPGLQNPTSECLAAWLWERLGTSLPSLASITVHETGECGANFDGTTFRIWKELSIDSAAQLTAAPAGDPRRRVHGHTYTVRLHLEGALDAVLGWTVDFGDVKRHFEPLFRRLDHRPLHEKAGLLRADAAGLAAWIRREAAPVLPALVRVDVFETPGCGAILGWGATAPVLAI